MAQLSHEVPHCTGVARGGPEVPAPPQRMRKKYQSYSLVNLTLNMRYKMTKNIKFVITLRR